MSLRVIAEAGENHLGDIDRALEMVRRAAGTGADFVKFQSYNVEDLSPETPPEALEWVSRVQLSVGDHRKLREAIHTLDELAVEVIGGLEIGDLAPDAHAAHRDDGIEGVEFAPRKLVGT